MGVIVLLGGCLVLFVFDKGLVVINYYCVCGFV